MFAEELKKQAAEQEQLKEEIKRLQTELDETKSQLTAVSLETESLESQKRTYQDEISSLQQIVNGMSFHVYSSVRAKILLGSLLFIAHGGW